jgi:hypothetical protein
LLPVSLGGSVCIARSNDSSALHQQYQKLIHDLPPLHTAMHALMNTAPALPQPPQSPPPPFPLYTSPFLPAQPPPLYEPPAPHQPPPPISHSPHLQFPTPAPPPTFISPPSLPYAQMMQQYQAAAAAWPTCLQPTSHSSHAIYPRCPSNSHGQPFLAFLEQLASAMIMFTVCPISTRVPTEEQEVQLLAACFQPGSEHRRCYDTAVAEERQGAYVRSCVRTAWWLSTMASTTNTAWSGANTVGNIISPNFTYSALQLPAACRMTHVQHHQPLHDIVLPTACADKHLADLHSLRQPQLASQGLAGVGHHVHSSESATIRCCSPGHPHHQQEMPWVPLAPECIAIGGQGWHG